MRSFTSDYRLQGLSTREIATGLDTAAAVLSGTYKFKTNKLKAGALLNALALWFQKLPEEEMVRFAGECLMQLELHLAEDDRERAEVEARYRGGKTPDGTPGAPGKLLKEKGNGREEGKSRPRKKA